MTNELVVKVSMIDSLGIIIPIAIILLAAIIYPSVREYRRIKQADVDKELSIKRMEAQLEAQSKMMEVKPYKDLMTIVDTIAGVYIAYEIVPQLNGEITPQDREELLISGTTTVCSNTLHAISPEVKRQLACYIDVSPNAKDDFLSYYLRKTVMTNIATLIDKPLGVNKTTK